MQPFDGVEMPAQHRKKRARQHRHAILGTFAVAYLDLAAAKIDVLDPQTRALEDAHACAVQQFAEQPMRAGQAAEKASHLRVREYDRQARRRLGANDTRKPRQINGEYFAVQEEERTLRLILRRCSDLAVGRELREELLDIASTEICRVAVLMEAKVPPNPIDVSFLGADTIVLVSDPIADLVQEARIGGWHDDARV
jgi:hypothetical protein